MSLGGFEQCNTFGCDTGLLIITVNGFQDAIPYGPEDVPVYLLAEYLVNTINGNNPYVTASTPGFYANPAIITLTAKTGGSNTNYPLSVTYYPYSPGTYPVSYTLTPSGPTLTGGTDAPAPVPGFINPKYLIVGVTYAPPGAQSNVTYTNSILVGTTTTIASSFSNQTQLSVSISADISAWGKDPVTGKITGKITGTESTSYTQGSSSSNAVTMSKTTTVADRTSGPANSFVPGGVDHDYDVIWLWLNPVLPFTFPDQTNPDVLTWNGFGYDNTDQPAVDVFPVFVGWLNGDIALPPDVAQVLARSWANTSNYVYGPGQGPGLTGPGPGTDFATILTADPFWQCTQSPANCPTTVDSQRYTLSINQNLVYEQAPVGGQPINQNLTFQYTNGTVTQTGTNTSFQQGFSLEEVFTTGFFFFGLTKDIKESNTSTWTNSFNKSLTNTANNTAAASITGPPCTVPNGANFCSPEYDGPAEFDIYIDNQYGTFMFFPVTDPRFRLAATPASRKISVGDSTTFAITSTAFDGFSGNVTLDVAGLPANTTGVFTSNPISGAGGSSTLTITTNPTTTPGTYPLTITGTSGTIVVHVPVTLVVQDFFLTATPGSATVNAPGTATYTVTAAGLNGAGFNANIAPSVSGLPAGATATFSPNPLPGASVATLTVTVPGSVPAGNYALTIIGTSGTLSHSTQVNLTVIAPDFTISAAPSSQSIIPGGCASYAVSITALNGFTGTVGLSQSGAPAGASATFNPLSINSSGSSLLTICTSTSTPAGSYTITITGISGSVIHSTAVILVVQDFSLSATPSSQTVAAGTGTSYTVFTTAINGFAGTVSLSISGFPSGTTATFNPTSINGAGSSTLTVTTATSTPGGTYTLTITGTSSGVSHSTTVTLIVTAPDFTIDATPASLSVTRGSSGNYTVTISAVSGFNGAVNLSVTGLPSRTSATFTPTSITGSGTSTLRITVQSNATRGTSTLTIRGTSGSLTHTKTVTLVIQ